MSPKTRGLVFTLAVTGVFFAACKEEKRVTQYTVSKEPAGAASNDFTTGNTAAPASNPVAASVTAATGQTAPSMANTAVPVAQGDHPAWTPAAGWSETSKPMRKGSWTAGETDIAVTAFPGDLERLGGLLANITRWCGEIGRPGPASETEAAALVTPVKVSGFDAHRVALENGGKTSVVIFITHDGATWFFKHKGPTAETAGVDKDFEAFVASVKFPSGK